MAEEKNFETYKEAGEQPPSTVENQAPEVAEQHAPSTSEPESTDIPSANASDPEAVNPQNPNAANKASDEKPEGEKKPAKKPPKAAQTDDEKPAKKPAAKKEKPPAVEDKPFAEFIQQDYMPALTKALAERGVNHLDLKFAKEKIPVVGMGGEPDCWQVIGSWENGRRQFRVYFFKEDISGQRAFSYSTNGYRPSTLEPFLIDERRVTLDLLVFGVFQRLNAQKWLALN